MLSKKPVAARAGALVREKREALNLTAAELATLCGFIDSSHVIKIEHGNGATLDNLAAIARGLKIPLKELVP